MANQEAVFFQKPYIYALYVALKRHLIFQMTKDDIIKSEELKMTWLDELSRNYPDVNSTKSISGTLENMRLNKEKTIRPSRLGQAFTMIVLLLLVYIWLWFLMMLLKYTFPFLVFLLGFSMVSLMIYMLISNSFLNKEYIYTIRINSDAISIRNNKFYWSDIAETYIVNKYEGRAKGYNSYLAIVRKDGIMEKFDLHKFGISDRKLSRIIEHYKGFMHKESRL